MRYKTSCFNPTLFRQNLCRFWPLPVGVFAYYLLSVVMPFWEIKNWAPLNEAMFRDHVLASIYGDAQMASFVMVFFAALAAALMFRHIHARKDLQFYLGLPMTRTCIYVTNLVSGYLMLAVPVILNMIILGITTLVWGYGFLSLPMTGCILSAVTIFYGLAVLASVLGGQTFGAFLIYLGLNIALYLVSMTSGEIMNWLLHGWNMGSPFYDVVQKLTPAAQYLELSIWEQVEGSGIYEFREGFMIPVYALAGAVIMVLSGWLYNIRRSETTGDTVSFQVVKPICKVFVALIVGMGLALFLLSSLQREMDLDFISILIPVLIFTVVGWIAAEMVIKKSFRVVNKRECLGCGILLVALIALGLGLETGGLGYETRTPDPEQVVSVNAKNIEMTTEDALSLHRYVIEHPQELSNGTGSYAWDTLAMNYTMEDGTVFSRFYYVKAGSSVDAYLESVLSKKDYIFQSWLGDLNLEVPNGGYVYFFENYEEDEENPTAYFKKVDREMLYNQSLSSVDAAKLYGAICQDIEEGNLPPRAYADHEKYHRKLVAEVSFEIKGKVPVEAAEGISAQAVQTVFVNIDPTMENTMEALREMGYEYVG